MVGSLNLTYFSIPWVSAVCSLPFLASNTNNLSLWVLVWRPRKNVVIALECTTVSSLMNADSFQKLWQPDWLRQASAVVSICIVAAAWNVDNNVIMAMDVFVNSVSGICAPTNVCVAVWGFHGFGLSPLVTFSPKPIHYCIARLEII